MNPAHASERIVRSKRTSNIDIELCRSHLSRTMSVAIVIGDIILGFDFTLDGLPRPDNERRENLLPKKLPPPTKTVEESADFLP